MSFITYNYIDRFLVVYLDDIVVHSESLEDHLSHLRKVLKRECNTGLKKKVLSPGPGIGLLLGE